MAAGGHHYILYVGAAAQGMYDAHYTAQYGRLFIGYAHAAPNSACHYKGFHTCMHVTELPISRLHHINSNVRESIRGFWLETGMVHVDGQSVGAMGSMGAAPLEKDIRSHSKPAGGTRHLASATTDVPVCCGLPLMVPDSITIRCLYGAGFVLCYDDAGHADMRTIHTVSYGVDRMLHTSCIFAVFDGRGADYCILHTACMEDAAQHLGVVCGNAVLPVACLGGNAYMQYQCMNFVIILCGDTPDMAAGLHLGG